MINYRLYRTARTVLPSGFIQRVASSPFLRPIRDAVLRPAGTAAIVCGDVAWGGLSFSFAAPPAVLFRAQTRGVENRLCRLARASLAEGDVAVDVGGNYGFVTIVLAHAVGPTGRVVVFEIDPSIAAVLQSNVDANRLTERVEVVACGAGAPDTSGTVTVDERLGDRRVRFLMIDTDGHDLAVLHGAMCVIRRDRPIVVVETNENGSAIYELLTGLGYTHFIGMSNEAVVPGQWPHNMIASTEPVAIPFD